MRGDMPRNKSRGIVIFCGLFAPSQSARQDFNLLGAFLIPIILRQSC
jgi:hypothetical protein